jgi:hypothetical protein
LHLGLRDGRQELDNKESVLDGNKMD